MLTKSVPYLTYVSVCVLHAQLYHIISRERTKLTQKSATSAHYHYTGHTIYMVWLHAKLSQWGRQGSTCLCGGGRHMDQITITTTNLKCRFYWCLIEFIDCHVTVSHVGILDPSCELALL
jgi:hypothetical protein